MIMQWCACAIFSGSQPVDRGPQVLRGHLSDGGPRAKATFLFCKNLNTQAQQFWQFSLVQFLSVVHDRETIIK